MSDNLQQPPTLPATASASPSPDAGEAPVVRKRSSHRHHRHNAHRRPGMTEIQKRRMLNFMTIAYAAPTLLALIGGVLLAVANLNPDPSLRPHGLSGLGKWMLIIGLGFFGIALVIDWTRRYMKYRRWKHEVAEQTRQSGRRRSSHHRHHRN